MDLTLARLSQIPNLTVSRDAPLSAYTRFAIGGPADLYAETESVESFIQALAVARASGRDFMVMGGGTNLIVSDLGFRGIMLRFVARRMLAAGGRVQLLLARWSARARELAVRAAIGAGRGRLARQLFTEIALLVAAGTVVAMILVAVALRGFVHFAAGGLPRLSEVAIDFRVFAIALLVSLATALIFGGLPALRAGRIDLQSVLQRAGRGGAAGGTRLARRVLVAVEVAHEGR